MNQSDARRMSRRSLLKGAALLASAATLPRFANRNAMAADSKLPQATVKYQDHPNGKMECDGCIQFIPGANPSATGTCKVVVGNISPHGYCIAYAPKPG